MIWLIIIIVLFAGLTGYFIYRAYVIAGALADTDDYIEEIEGLTKYMFDQINATYEEMKRVDHTGAFHESDEVGTTFSILKDVVENLHKEFNGPEEEKE
tara:strand:- start:685 stop:981 length:297 start_codon:yes stop_codon:yes gene_type:complete